MVNSKLIIRFKTTFLKMTWYSLTCSHAVKTWLKYDLQQLSVVYMKRVYNFEYSFPFYVFITITIEECLFFCKQKTKQVHKENIVSIKTHRKYSFNWVETVQWKKCYGYFHMCSDIIVLLGLINFMIFKCNGLLCDILY